MEQIFALGTFLNRHFVLSYINRDYSINAQHSPVARNRMGGSSIFKNQAEPGQI